MAKLVTKFKYLKSNSRHTSGRYAKYIATREGVEKIDDTNKYLPSTKKQNKLIDALLKDYPDSQNSLEYEDYMSRKTIGTAAEFISRTIENNMDSLLKNKTYADYIATRPGTERFGSHGLFTDDGVYVDLKNVSEELNSYDGNVWIVIISLRREDAERLGFDKGQRWRDMLRTQTDAFSECFKIPIQNLKWFAAFHNESHHPHVHLMIYSKNKEDGYLSRQGVEKLRSSIANDIFSQDLLNNYEKQNIYRNQLKQEAAGIIHKLLQRINCGYCKSQKLEDLFLLLSEKLAKTNGKKTYGYLKHDTKEVVDKIINEICNDNMISELYDLWYKQKEEIIGFYTSRPSDRIPLSKNNEFRSIKNTVIKEALNISIGKSEKPQNNLNSCVAVGAMNLMYYVCNLFRDKIGIDHPAKIDRKQLQKTSEKKQAQGMKPG